MSNQQWCLIESDPGVFTSLIESFGVKNAELTELWSLDDDSLRALGSKVYGLIFLFKWQKQGGQSSSSSTTTGGTAPLTGTNIPSDLYFARQVTTNACATQAILSILMNAQGEEKGGDDGDLVLGDTISSLRSFTASFPPELRGEAIGASEEIRTAHNSFARNDSFLTEQRNRMAEEDDDVFHFVAYVPHYQDGNVYELDGLQEGPIRVGSFDKDEKKDLWIDVARKAIQERMERYSTSEIKFNLMAVVRDRRLDLNERLEALKQAGMSDDSVDMADVRSQLASEEEKRNQWKLENERRRHNYLPLLLEVLKGLARSGKLEDITEKARERLAEKNAAAAKMAIKGK